MQVVLNAQPSAPVTVACQSQSTSTLPDGASSDYTVTFTATTGLTPAPLRLGTVAAMAPPNVTVQVVCKATTAAGGLATTDTTTFTVTAQPLAIRVLAGTAAVKPTGDAWSAGAQLGLTDAVLRGENAADASGATLSLVLNGNPTATTVVTCRSSLLAFLPDSGTASDFTVSFTTSNGLTAVGLELGTVANLRRDQDASVVCKADGAGGIAVGETAAVGVRLRRLRIVLVAGTAASAAAGGSITAGSSLSASDTLARVENAADAAGGTLSVKLSGNPTATTVVSCVSSNTSAMASPAAQVTFGTANGQTAQALTLATVGDLSADAAVTLSCTADGLGGIGTDEPALASLTLRKLAIVVTAGTAAVDPTGKAYAQGAALGNGVARVEGQADAKGATVQVALNGNPTADVQVACTSSSGTLPNSSTATDYQVTFKSTTGTAAVGIALGTVGSISTAATATVTCAATSTAGGLSTSDTTTFTVSMQPLAIVVVAGSAAVQPDGTVLTPGATLGSAKVARLEGQPDTAGQSVSLTLNGALSAAVTVTCTSGSTTVLPDSTGASASFASTTGAVAVKGLTLGTVSTATGVVTADTDVVVTCAPTADGGGLARTDSVTFTVTAQPLRINLQAGSSSAYLGASAFSVTATEGTALLVARSATTAGVDVMRVGAGASSLPGQVVKAVLNGNPGASVTVKCTSQDTTVVPNPYFTASYTATFTTTTGTTPHAVTVGAPPLHYQLQAVAGSAAPAATPTMDTLPSGTRLQVGQRCLSVAAYEGIQTAAGQLVSLAFDAAATAIIQCTSGDTTAVASVGTVTVTAATSVGLQIPAPAALASGSKTVTFTCAAAASPAPTGVTAGLSVSFDVVVLPLSVDAVVGSGGATRQLDGTALAAGASVSFTGSSPPASRTLVVSEGAGTLSTLVAIKVIAAPTAPVTFTCKPNNTAVAASVDVTVTDASATPVPLPSFTNVDKAAQVVYSCTPKADAGGYRAGAANHTVQFAVYVVPARIVPQAAATAFNVAGAAIPAGTDISGASAVASTEVAVYASDAANSSRVQLVPSVAPGVAGKVSCVSSATDTLQSLLSVAVSATGGATALTLPAPAVVSADVDITYTCAPDADFGPFRTTDLSYSYVRVVALRLDAVAASGLTTSDGAVLAAGAVLTGGGAGKTVVANELQPVNSTTVALRLNASPSAAVTVACASDTPDVMANAATVSLNSASPGSVALPTPAAVAADTLVTYTCAPAAAAGGVTAGAKATFAVLVRQLTVQAQAASAQTSAAGTALAAGTQLVSGSPSRTPSIVEGSPATSTLAQLVPSAAPSAPVTYSCTSSAPAVLASVPTLTVPASAGPVPFPLPATGAVDADTTVTYSCKPTADAGGLKTTQVTTFDVVVASIKIVALSGSAQTAQSGAGISSLATLRSGIAALTPRVIAGTTTAAGQVVKARSCGERAVPVISLPFNRVMTLMSLDPPRGPTISQQHNVVPRSLPRSCN